MRGALSSAAITTGAAMRTKSTAAPNRNRQKERTSANARAKTGLLHVMDTAPRQIEQSCIDRESNVGNGNEGRIRQDGK